MKVTKVDGPNWTLCGAGLDGRAEHRSAISASAGSLLPVRANTPDQHVGRAALTSLRRAPASPSLHHRWIFQLSNSAAVCSRPSLTRRSPPAAPPSERRLISRRPEVP